MSPTVCHRGTAQVVVEVGIDGRGDMRGRVGVLASGRVRQTKAAIYHHPIGRGVVGIQGGRVLWYIKELCIYLAYELVKLRKHK